MLKGICQEESEKEYQKEHPNKPIQDRPYRPHVDDVMEYCSLEEVADFLKDDPELTDDERFELYYDEREKRREKKSGLTYEQLLKKSGVKPPSAKKQFLFFIFDIVTNIFTL